MTFRLHRGASSACSVHRRTQFSQGETQSQFRIIYYVKYCFFYIVETQKRPFDELGPIESTGTTPDYPTLQTQEMFAT